MTGILTVSLFSGRPMNIQLVGAAGAAPAAVPVSKRIGSTGGGSGRPQYVSSTALLI